MAEFVHLNIHSEFSLVDGLIRLPELMSRAQDLGMKAIGLSDQSNLFAMVKFYRQAKAANIKPLIGADVYLQQPDQTDHPQRVLLYCQNQTGYHTLTELISSSYISGQVHGKAIISFEEFSKHNEGLLCILHATESDIGRALTAPDQALAAELAQRWQKLLSDRVYLEVTRLVHSANEQQHLQQAVDFSENTNFPLVASNQVRFIDAQDFEAHEARVCINQGTVLDDPKRPRDYQPTQYLRSPEEMVALFKDIPEALENTVQIAKRCNLQLTFGKVFLPNYPVPDGLKIEDYFVSQAQRGLEKRLQVLLDPKSADYTVKEKLYWDRLSLELDVLNKMGYAGYFLIVADFINWAKEHKIPVGPGRGSGAGSLVAYSLEITNLDPLAYDLLFERFLNPERVSMPDFDIDFCMEGRDSVIEYVANTYGKESVSQIITYGTMAAKAVIRDVGRVLNHPYGFVDKIAKLIPNELGITLDRALQMEAALLQRYQQEDEVRTLMDLAKKLEGITRNVGKHAGGVVIAPSKLTDFTPLYCEDNGSALVSQFDKNDVETIGLVKFDFLGLKTLTIIDWASNIINATLSADQQIDINTISLNDPQVFSLLQSHQTTAVFQLESRGMKDLIRRLHPDQFEDIVALVALFRPGPLQSGMVDDFINRKHGRAKVSYPHPDLEPILKPTYGVILYQEQVMQIAQVLAGYTLGAADLLRRAMGKKKPEEMAKQRVIFTEGAVKRGVEESTATYIFDLMEKFAGYGFNKSHSAAYALVTYQTAWLKTHYPEAFMASVLSVDMNNTDKVVVLIEECRQMHINVLPPDINASEHKFTVAGKQAIRYGLGAIKGVGESAIAQIIHDRGDSPFKDLFDFCMRCDIRKVSRKVIEALIKSGALESLGSHRHCHLVNLEDAIKAAEQKNAAEQQGQSDLFGSFSEVQAKPIVELKHVPEWKPAVRLQGEKETLGLYLTGHPIDDYVKELSGMVTSSIADLQAAERTNQWIAGFIVALRTLQTKRGDRMAFVTLDDKTARQEVAVFSDTFHQHRELLEKDKLLIVEGEAGNDEYSGGIRFRAKRIIDLDTARAERAKAITLKLDAQKLDNRFSEQLKSILQPYQQGQCLVNIEYQMPGGKAQLSLGPNWRVMPRESLLEALRGEYGKDCIMLDY